MALDRVNTKVGRIWAHLGTLPVNGLIYQHNFNFLVSFYLQLHQIFHGPVAHPSMLGWSVSLHRG